MATVLLTGDFSEAVTVTDTEVADTRSIMLRLLSTIVLANGDVHSPQRWVITLTAGAFTRYLVVPDDATAARYSIILPDGSEQVFTLASTDGPTITVAEVLLLNLVDIEPDALAALLALYTPLATYTPAVAALQADINTRATSAALTAGLATKEASLGNPGTNGYVLSSLTNGTRSWIAPGGVSALVWTPILLAELNTGWIFQGAGFGDPAYCIVGNGQIKLRGAIFRSSGGLIDILISPIAAAARPSVIRYVGLSQAGTLRVNPSGVLQLWAGPATPMILDGVEYSL